jgi:hypothetical protein
MEERILFTWATQGYWWKGQDGEPVWLGGFENVRRFGVSERDMDNALRHPGQWVNCKETERVDA